MIALMMPHEDSEGASSSAGAQPSTYLVCRTTPTSAVGRGWADYSGGATPNPNSGGSPRFDKQVVCSVSGPEPG